MHFGKDFFAKHQRTLLWIANHRSTRWLLGVGRVPKELRNRPLIKITPNSAHWMEPDGQVEATLYVRPIFAERLAFNLAPVCQFQTTKGRLYWRVSPVGAFGMFFGFLLFKETGIPAFFATTSDFSPVAGANSPCDGEVVNNPSSSTWSTVRDAATGTGASATDAQQAPYTRVLSTVYIINRSIINVDASAIGDGDTITEASYNAYCEATAVGDADANAYIGIVQSTPAGTNTVATADFDQLGTTEWATGIAISSLTTSAFNAFTWNATGIAGISKTGITSFGLREGHDLNNDPITGVTAWNYGIFTSADGASNDPYLRVTYSSTSLKTLNGLAIASVKTKDGLAIASVKTINGLA